MGCAIIGCGKALPALEIANNDFIQLVDTNDEWITKRTGIKTRRIAATETNVDLAETAARQALGWSEGGYSEKTFAPEDIDLIIYSSVTPDTIVPSSASLLRRRLGLVNATAFDINAACTGFVYGMSVVESMLAASTPGAPGSKSRNTYHRALVVGSERLTRITNWEDRATCVLLGDGAGAAVVEWREDRPGILATYLVNDDDFDNALSCPMSFDSKPPFDENGVSKEVIAALDPSLSLIDDEIGIKEDVEQGRSRQLLYMHGQKVFKFASKAMGRAIDAVCERCGVSVSEIKCIVPHQANERIIKFAAKRCGLPLDCFQVSIANRGNSSSACVPMALADAYESGRIQPGDKVILVAFGGGFTSGAVLFEA